MHLRKNESHEILPKLGVLSTRFKKSKKAFRKYIILNFIDNSIIPQFFNFYLKTKLFSQRN